MGWPRDRVEVEESKGGDMDEEDKDILTRIIQQKVKEEGGFDDIGKSWDN